MQEEHWKPPPNNPPRMEVPEVRIEKAKKTEKMYERKRKHRKIVDEVTKRINKLPTGAQPYATFILQLCSYVGSCGKNRQSNKVAPITSKIQARHLELEPLCCLSSCLVRGGCTAVVAFEAFFIATTLICMLIQFYSDGHFHFWRPFEQSFNAYITHPIFFYILLAFDLITVIAALCLTHGLFRFDKSLLRLHYRYDLFALCFHVTAFLLYAFAISTKGSQHWDFPNTLLVLSFLSQIPVQIWALSVVKSCADFFALIHVFVSLADS
ncbi:unnamed protein product, partial [Mesorhabditis belari]|uniref:MARVEL domain-containing protein n=1 Tax=Mesorhabditis belari TaxID=2138241 RepID=A0AAF3EA16_9BILA